MKNKTVIGILTLILIVSLSMQVRSVTDTGSYYLDVPLPISSYYIGVFTNGTFYACNGSNWRMFTHGSDAQAITQTCIDTATAAGGGEIRFGAGTFTFDSTINVKEGVYLRGEGPHATIFQASNVAADPIISLDDDYTAVENVKISGNWLEVQGVQFAQALDEFYVWMRDVRITECNKSAVYIGPAGWFSLIEHCWIQGNNATGITINMTTNNCGYWPTVKDTLIKMNTGHGVHLVQTDKWGPAILHNCVIEYAGRKPEGGYVEAWGVYVEKHPIHIIECALEANYYTAEYGIYLGATSSVDTACSKIISCSAVGNIVVDYAHYTILRDVTLRGGCGLNITTNADNTYVENVVKRLGTVNVTDSGTDTTLAGWNAP